MVFTSSDTAACIQSSEGMADGLRHFVFLIWLQLGLFLLQGCKRRFAWGVRDLASIADSSLFMTRGL